MDQNEAQHSAKVQSGAELLCKSAKVGYKSIEYGVLSIGRYNVSGGGWQLQVAGGGKKTSTGLWSRLIGYQVRVIRCGYGCGQLSAKVQMRLSRVQKCKGERDTDTGGGWRPQVAGGGKRDKDTGETGNRMIGWEIIFGSQVSAIGSQVRVFWFGYGCGPEPAPDAEYPNPKPDGRDPGPENESYPQVIFRSPVSH